MRAPWWVWCYEAILHYISWGLTKITLWYEIVMINEWEEQMLRVLCSPPHTHTTAHGLSSWSRCFFDVAADLRPHRSSGREPGERDGDATPPRVGPSCLPLHHPVDRSWSEFTDGGGHRVLSQPGQNGRSWFLCVRDLVASDVSSATWVAESYESCDSYLFS